MSYLRLIFFVLIVSSSCFVSGLNAQIKQISEDEVNTQKMFIDATKEKIMGQYENAAELFNEVLKRDKKNDAAAYELARIYEFQGKKDKALKSIKIAVEIDPENNWYQMFLANTYESQGQFKNAIKVYEGLKDKYPRDAFYFEKIAYIQVKAQSPEKAIKTYNEMEKNFGIHEDISKRKHRIYLGMGNTKKAAGELENLIRYYPSNTDYYHMLASFYSQIGDQSSADKTYQRILEVDPADVKASMAISKQGNTSSSDDSYLASLKDLFERDDVNIDLKLKEFIPYIEKIANREADASLTVPVLELAQILENTHPKDAKSYAAHGDLMYYTGNRDGALSRYKKALELNKSIFSVWEQVMYIYVETNDFNSLMTISEDAIDRFPNQAKAYYFNGIALSQEKKRKQAVNSYKQALLMSRKNPLLQIDIYNHLATEYHLIGNIVKSNIAFDDALKINPKNHLVLNRYSYFLATRGESLDKAKSMSALSNELAPNQAVYQDTYGWILYKMKEYKAAKEWFSKALTNGGNTNPGILEHYGDVLFQLKEIEEAISYWQKALDLGSTSPILEKKIADRKIYE